MDKATVHIDLERPIRYGVVYGRVSTSNDGQKTSLDYQTNMFYEYAERNNINITKIYAEVGSGTSITKRKEFKQLLADAELRQFDCILTKDVSRWSRDNLGFLETIRHLTKIGIIVYFVDIGLNSQDDEMTLLILAAVAQKEALNTRAKTKSVRRYQVEHGAVPAMTFGYDNIRGTGAYSLSINEQEATIIRQIFEMYANGIGAQYIIRSLNKAGIKSKHGNDFELQDIRRILRNKIYIGILQNNKQESLDKRVEREIIHKERSEWLEHERPDLRIVDPAVFYKCQELLDQKQKVYKCQDRVITGWNLPFTKTLICAECGGMFRRNRSGKYVYFKCNTRLITDLETCGNNVSIREDDLYNEVKVYMIALLKQRGDIEQLIDKRLREKLSNQTEIKTVESIKAELEETKKKKIRAMELYINEGNDEVKPMIDKLTKKINSLEAELNRKQSTFDYDSNIYSKKIAGLFNTIEEFINCPDIRDLDGERFNQIFQSIKVHKDGHLEITLTLFGEKKTLNSMIVHQGTLSK